MVCLSPHFGGHKRQNGWCGLNTCAKFTIKNSGLKSLWKIIATVFALSKTSSKCFNRTKALKSGFIWKVIQTKKQNLSSKQKIIWVFNYVGFYFLHMNYRYLSKREVKNTKKLVFTSVTLKSREVGVTKLLNNLILLSKLWKIIFCWVLTV